MHTGQLTSCVLSVTFLKDSLGDIGASTHFWLHTCSTRKCRCPLHVSFNAVHSAFHAQCMLRKKKSVVLHVTSAVWYSRVLEERKEWESQPRPLKQSCSSSKGWKVSRMWWFLLLSPFFNMERYCLGSLQSFLGNYNKWQKNLKRKMSYFNAVIKLMIKLLIYYISCRTNNFSQIIDLSLRCSTYWWKKKKRKS